MNELKRCPFCGEMPETDGRLVKWWQSRPIEAVLQSCIAELEAEVTKCHELQDSYCDRIVELEGLLSRMAKAGDGLTMNPKVSDYAERLTAWDKVWLEWKNSGRKWGQK